MPRPKLRTAALRAAILDATRALLESEGAAACTTRRIARRAGTSPPALYELFGDKAGLLRAVFFEGFRELTRALDQPPSPDPRADLDRLADDFRGFARQHPALTELMFSRSVATYDPSPEERAAGAGLRSLLVAHITRWLAAEGRSDDPVDLGHALLSVALGLALQERAGWLGSTPANRTRRWRGALRRVLDGPGGA